MSRIDSTREEREVIFAVAIHDQAVDTAEPLRTTVRGRGRLHWNDRTRRNRGTLNPRPVNRLSAHIGTDAAPIAMSTIGRSNGTLEGCTTSHRCCGLSGPRFDDFAGRWRERFQDRLAVNWIVSLRWVLHKLLHRLAFE